MTTADVMTPTGDRRDARPTPPPADLRILGAALAAWAALAGSLSVPVATRGVMLAALLFGGLLARGVTARRRHTADRRRRRRAPAHAAARPGIPLLGLLAAAILLLQVAALGHQVLRSVGPLDDLTAERAVVTLTGTVVTDPRPITSSRGDPAVLVRLDADRVSGRGREAPAYGPIMVRGNDNVRALRWGSTVTVTGRLSPTEPGDPEAAALRVTGVPRTVQAPGVVARVAEHLRSGLRDSVAQLPADARGLVPGLVIGDTSQLPPSLDAAMRATGMTHLTAVSGSNVAVVLALVFGLCRLIGVPRRLRPWLALAVLAGFVVLARPEPSVLRAATMGAIGVLGLSAHRHGVGLPVLGGAILTVLVWDPWLSRSYGFALSTLATLGLLVLARPWGERMAVALGKMVDGQDIDDRVARGQDTDRHADRGPLGPGASPLRAGHRVLLRRLLRRALRRVPRRTRSGAPTWSVLGAALAVPVAAQVVCAPVIVLLQSSVSVVGVLANLLAAPLVPLTTIGGVAVAGLALVWPTGAQWLAWLPGIPALAISRIGRVLADVPYGSIPWPGGATGALSLAVLTVAILLLGRSLVALAGSRPMASLSVVLLAAASLTPTRVLTWPPPGWQLVSCDVGQGDATVLRTGPGSAVVVDAGPDPDLVDTCLDRLDVTTIDAVVLTHFHLDHAGGLEGISRGRTVGVLLTTWVAEPEDIVRGVRAWSLDHSVPAQELHVGDSLRFGTVTAHVWWPERRISAGSVPNNASVVLAVEDGGIRALLLGDLEHEAGAALLGRIRRDPELAAAAADFDVVKSPHHGSANIDPQLLATVRAPLAIISVGADNDYGHPAPSHLRVLQELGYAVRRTDLVGAIAVTHSSTGTHAVTER